MYSLKASLIFCNNSLLSEPKNSHITSLIFCLKSHSSFKPKLLPDRIFLRTSTEMLSPNAKSFMHDERNQALNISKTSSSDSRPVSSIISSIIFGIGSIQHDAQLYRLFIPQNNLNKYS